MLRYDFDVVAGHGAKINDAGQLMGVTARFRYAKTVEALRSAEPIVRDFFQASGFDMALSDSGMPANCFMAADKASRDAIIARLGENLPMLDAGVREWGDIDLRDLTDSYLAATPIDAAEVIERDDAPKSRGLALLGIGACAGLMAVVAVATLSS